MYYLQFSKHVDLGTIHFSSHQNGIIAYIFYIQDEGWHIIRANPRYDVHNAIHTTIIKLRYIYNKTFSTDN